MQMLRLQVQRSKDRHRDKQREDEYVEELELHSLLGKGGFGSVFLGQYLSWHLFTYHSLVSGVCCL